MATALVKLVFIWAVATGPSIIIAVYAWRYHSSIASRIFWTALAVWVALYILWRTRLALRLLLPALMGRSALECPGCGQLIVVNPESGVSPCPRCGDEFNLSG